MEQCIVVARAGLARESLTEEVGPCSMVGFGQLPGEKEQRPLKGGSGDEQGCGCTGIRMCLGQPESNVLLNQLTHSQPRCQWLLKSFCRQLDMESHNPAQWGVF